MTNAFRITAAAGGPVAEEEGGGRVPLTSRLAPMAALFSLLTVATVLLLNMPMARDYVGADNDDVMRLVVVRDLLAGQGWFDMTQYRLGLEGGTLMHWSRFVDAPIAALVLLFRLFLAPQAAEAAALAVWPLSLVPLLIAFMGLGGRRLGGTVAMNVAMGFGALLVITSNRFLPGAIDHHNVQLVLVAALAAMLMDGRYRAVNYALGGVAAALAIAIGAETMPLLAILCLAVAVLWAVRGEAFAPAARAFGLSLTLAVSAAFFLTVPPSLYSTVTCDSLSLGFYGLSSIGGMLLFLSARFLSGRPMGQRFAVLAANGVLVALSALTLAPQCLGNPLSTLDPLLVTLWLSNVTEAQSVVAQVGREPATAGGFYAVGFFAAAVCVSRILRRDRVESHALLLALVLVAWTVALIQVRGAVFANLLAILPLSLLVAELRARSHAEPENIAAGFFYFTATLVSVPAVWVVAGALPSEGVQGIVSRFTPAAAAAQAAGGDATCAADYAALAQLAALPPGVVAAPSNAGAQILRHTGHRVLSAPYHRNQGGMLTELHIGLSVPQEALAFLRGAGVSVLAFCAGDPQTRQIVRMKPDGLYAQLQQGKVPPYLEPLPAAGASGWRFFRVLP